MTTMRRRGNERAVGLEEVAAKAGVHPMTVSRALQGSSKVTPATRERIEGIARELNYVPNTAARALAMGKTHVIAAVIGSINEHYYGNLLHLLQIELAKSDYKVSFFHSRDLYGGLGGDLLSAISARAVDGIIAVDAFTHIEELTHSGAELPPRVYAGVGVSHTSVAASADVVEVDLEPGVREAFKSMLSSGCRRVALLVPGMLNPFYDARTSTYLKMMSEAGRPLEFVNVENGPEGYDHELVRSRLIAYLQAHGCPDGLFCYNDEMAVAAFRALRDLGYRIPDDVQLVGCDGIPYMAYFDPTLSTVVQPAGEMCALAWQFLKRRIEDRDCPLQAATLEAHLVIRASLKEYMG